MVLLMATNNSTGPVLLTLCVQECEHSGDIERETDSLQGARVLKTAVCDGPEEGYLVVQVTDQARFDAWLVGLGALAGIAGKGDVMDDLVSEAEGMHEYEY